MFVFQGIVTGNFERNQVSHSSVILLKLRVMHLNFHVPDSFDL